MSFPYRAARYTDHVPWIIHEHDFMCFNTLNIYHKYLLTCWTYTFSLTVDGFCRLDLKFIIYLFRKKIVTVRFHGLCTIVMGWWKIRNNTGISTVTNHTGIFIVPIGLTYLSFLHLYSRAIMRPHFMTVYFLLKEVKNYIKALISRVWNPFFFSFSQSCKYDTPFSL